MTKYWCVNFDLEPCLKHGLANKCWMMQYQYKDDSGNVFQDKRKQFITTNWKQIGKIKEGDQLVAYLGKNRFFAIGTAIKPRHPKEPNDATDTIENHLKHKQSHKYPSGYVYYTDTDVFYQNFSDEWRLPDNKLMRYAQRIDVDEWQHSVPQGVVVKGLGKSVPVNEIQKAAFEIPKRLFDEIRTQLCENRDGEAGKKSKQGMSGRFSRELKVSSDELTDTEYFSPKDLKDERKRLLREVAQRRGQSEFRKKLLEAYNRRCAITGCDAESALEASHIHAHCGVKSNHVTNGLLLRADIHTLIDLELVGVNPSDLTVKLKPLLLETCYREFDGKPITVPKNPSKAPNIEALENRWIEFCKE